MPTFEESLDALAAQALETHKEIVAARQEVCAQLAEMHAELAGQLAELLKRTAPSDAMPAPPAPASEPDHTEAAADAPASAASVGGMRIIGNTFVPATHEDRLQRLEAAVAKYGPMLDEAMQLGERLRPQGVTVGGMLSQLATKFLGVL